MAEVIVIFSLAATGCLVRLSTDLALQLLAGKARNGTIVTGPSHRPTPESHAKPDPIVTFGLTLTCYGAISLVLVAELAGGLANERTCLAFALLCAGGLIGEIARTCPAAETDNADSGEQARSRGSVGLSVALMLMLNLAVAVLCSGQGLVQIVPPDTPVRAGESPELEQIVVVARRTAENRGDRSSFL